MGRFEGRNLVVTGGTSGIGLATALRIADEGGRVLVTGRDQARLDEAQARHPAISGVVSDAADPECARALAVEAERRFGHLDGVFLNAGAGGESLLGTITLASFRAMFELNVAGSLFGAQALAPLVREGGSLLLMSSGAKTHGVAGIALYAGCKGAVRSISLVLSRELAPRGIRVNTISPGPIDTPFHGVGHSEEAQREFKSFMQRAITMGRFGRVEEAAAVASFLLSSEASFVNGADYAVDGGDAQ